MAKTKVTQKKRKVIVESIGEAHVTASFNNIIISLTNKKGDVISWSLRNKSSPAVNARLLYLEAQ